MNLLSFLEPEMRQVLDTYAKDCAREQGRMAAASLASTYEEVFPEQLNAAYRRATPPTETRARYKETFKAFQAFANEHGAVSLPSCGMVVGAFLVGLAVDGKPFAEVREAARAIEYYNHLFSNAPYIDAALKIAEEIAAGGDDGGGKELDNGGKEVPAVGNVIELPLAAQPQHKRTT
jgi:hypothetical protein